MLAALLAICKLLPYFADLAHELSTQLLLHGIEQRKKEKLSRVDEALGSISLVRDSDNKLSNPYRSNKGQLPFLDPAAGFPSSPGNSPGVGKSGAGDNNQP